MFWREDFWKAGFWADDFWIGVTTSGVAAAEEDAPSGGYGWENEYDSYRKRTTRKRKIRKITRQRVRKIKDPVDREIAQKLHKVIERQAQEAEIRELSEILSRANQAMLFESLENRGLLEAYEQALELANFSSMQKLERLLNESYTEEEETFMLLLSL